MPINFATCRNFAAGFPYADCFVVQVRHVASRVGNEDLSIQIGMSVQFLKSCLFEKKIKVRDICLVSKCRSPGELTSASDSLEQYRS